MISDRDLASLNLRLLQDSASYMGEEILPKRERNRRYYDGETPDGLKDEDGRSQIVDNVVKDTVEWILPSLIRIFTSGDKMVTIEGQGEEDAEKADLVEAWVNYVEQRHNSGFLNDYTWFKDALIDRDGWERVYWASEERIYREDYELLSQEAFAELEKEEDYEVLSSEPATGLTINPLTGEPEEFQGLSVTGNRIESEWQQRIEVVDPDNVLFPDGQTIDRKTWYFVSYKDHKRIAELREEGFDIDDDINGPELEQGQYETIDSIREMHENDDDDDYGQIDPGMRKVWVYESFIKVDADQDGRAEWVKVVQVGDQILSRDQEPEPNLFHLTPVIRQHRLSGDSVADLVYELQELMTALNRQVLDNIYLTNNPRAELVQQGMTEHTWKDYNNTAVGAPIRVKQQGTVNPLAIGGLQPWTFNLLEYWEGKRETRAGVTRYNQGLDANSLNKTATGVMQIFNAAQQRIELIARIFAETGVRDKIRYIIDSAARYPEYVDERSIKLQGRRLNINSKDVQGRYDLVINAAIGTGNKQQTMQNVMLLMQFYQQAAAAGLGPGSEQALYNLDNLFNAASEMIKSMGWRNTSDFLIDPRGEGADEIRDPVSPPQPNPDVIKAQTEAEKSKGELEVKQQQVQVDREEAMGKLQVEREKLAIERERLQLDQARMGIELQQAQAQPASEGQANNVVELENAIAERDLREREVALKEREADAKIAAMSRETRDAAANDQAMREVIAELSRLREEMDAPKAFERNAFGQVVSINGAPVVRDENGLVLGIGQKTEAGNEYAG